MLTNIFDSLIAMYKFIDIYLKVFNKKCYYKPGICFSESTVTEKAGAILGINRAQSVQINNGVDSKSENHQDNTVNPMVSITFLSP